MSTIIVEDGSFVTNANSYVTTAELQTYADDRGITISASDLTQLLIKSMDYIETLVYKGVKKNFSQILQWPRLDVWIDDYYHNSGLIPIQLKNGQIEVALAIDSGNDPLKTLPRAEKRVRIEGAVEVEYFTASSANVVRTISASLWKLLAGSGGYNQIRINKA